MSAIDNTPSNKNFLSPLNFKFIIKRAPHLNFFVQKVTIPGITLPATYSPNPIVRIPEIGDQLEYDELSISFRVDENLQNYLEIQNWMRGSGKQSFEQYSTLASNPSYTGESIKSVVSLTVLSNAKRPNYEFVFEEAFPTKISSITFDSSMEDVSSIEAEVEFRYIKFEILKITA